MSALVRLRKKDAISIHCPICSFPTAEKSYVYSYDDKQSHIVECCQCGHRWITPIPLEHLQSRHMDSVDDGELFDSGILRDLHKWFVVFPEIHAVRKYKGQGVLKLLDVACGTGWALSHWKERDFLVTGLEASDRRRYVCRERYGVDVVPGFIEDFRSDEQFDVITMRHILEHIEHPVTVLKKVKSLLKDDGVLSITVPNTNSIGRYLFQEKHAWVLPWHVHFYYPKTLTALLERVGFHKVKMYQVPSPLWYPNSAIDLFSPESFWARTLAKTPRILLMMLFAPIVLVGWMFGVSDNVTILATKRQ